MKVSLFSFLSAVLWLGVITTYAQESEEVVKLEKFEVKSTVPIEENILPTKRPFDSVYGNSRSILETPRNVTIISRAQLDAISVQDVRDFSKLTSSSYTRSNFGAPSNPDLRGQVSDVFTNGMRKGLTSNGNGMPINFNSVESVNIVKGPASAVYGASHYVGGYVDLITKRPYFDKAEGSLSITAGMYDQFRWNLDYGAPVSEKTAYRISYTGEASGSYYENGHKDVQALYGAVVIRPSDSYDIFLSGEVFWADYTENFGVNRPTQDLIDHGLYMTGVNQNSAPTNAGPYPGLFGNDYNDGNGNPIDFGNIAPVGGTPAPQSDPQNSMWVVSGFPAINNMNYTGTVPLDRKKRLLRPGDGSNGYNVTAQALITFHLQPGFEVSNNTFFGYIERDTLSSYSYSEIIDPSMSIENRTEFRIEKDKHKINTGFSIRFQHVEAYNDYFNEPANVWDITQDPNFINYNNSVNYPNPFTQVPVPGWPGRVATPGNEDTNDSDALKVGPFYQHDWRVTDTFSLLMGIRAEHLSVDYKDPLGTFEASEDVWLLNWNTSGLYKFTERASVYVTYNYSENPGGSVGNGGGYQTANVPFTKGDLQQESELFEAGIKISAVEDTLFFNAAVFDQMRTNLQQGGSIVEITNKGFELEVNYQPNRNFYATFGYSFIDSEVNTPEFFVRNTFPLLPGVAAAPGVVQTRTQGLPENLLNMLVSWTFDNGFGFTLGGVVTSSINNNTLGTIVIPTQFSIDGSVSYRTDTWETKLALLNLTDEENWSAPNAVYGEESIVAELPFRAELTVKYKF